MNGNGSATIRRSPTGREVFVGSSPRVASALADFTLGYYRHLPPGGKAFLPDRNSPRRVKMLRMTAVGWAGCIGMFIPGVA
jgi:hypothetical protein